MGVVEDIRQVIQDLVAPQLKSLDVKLTALEASTNQRSSSIESSLTQRIASLEASVTQRFANAEAVATARHEALTAQIAQLANIVATNHAAVLQKLDLEKRIDRVEMFQAARYELPPLPATLEASKP
jgi:uncharacterized protein YicC (UPF0701 family)